jgi:nitrogen regulatory protein P-II 1
MKKIEAVIRPCKLDEVKEALAEDGIHGMTISEIKGFDLHGGNVLHGRKPLHYRGAEYVVDFIPMIKMEILIDDDHAASACQVIEVVARTNGDDDGRIFVLPVEDAVRIRTGHRGESAI